ncbi:hypothetical protein [Halobaculum sp. MBLA0143]|uniref:hypothetical protein n=1 Tax=Halobaculum sp. MBLA0143 TaxID=3079933 RepID=UPI003524E0EB
MVRVLSRAIVTWVELVVVGFAGAALGSATSGPPQLVVYLATTLVSVSVLLYNVDRLVAARVANAGGDERAETEARSDDGTDTHRDGVV